MPTAENAALSHSPPWGFLTYATLFCWIIVLKNIWDSPLTATCADSANSHSMSSYVKLLSNSKT